MTTLLTTTTVAFEEVQQTPWVKLAGKIQR